MKKNIIFISILLCFLTISCADFIDVVPDNIPTLDNAFTDRTQAEKFLFSCYSQLPKRGNPYVEGHFDDLVWSNRNIDWLNQYQYIILRDGNNASNPLCNNWDGINGGNYMFQAIRNCNILIERIYEVRDLEVFEKDRWAAEAKFLKAFYHFYLLQLYGPIPIIRDNRAVTDGKEKVMVYRDPVDDVFDYIFQLIDEAVPFLPLKIENGVSEQGRITQAIALSVKAKIAVTAASPLFNGNSDYASFRDKRGVQLFNTIMDPSKWVRAVLACKNAIDTCLLAGHDLYELSNVSLKVSEETRQVLQVSRIITDKWNSEHIWGYSGSNTSYSMEEYTLAPLTADHNSFVRGVTVPTLKAIELFYSKNGVPIDEDIDFDYENRYELELTVSHDKAYVQTGVQTAKLHLNREPRFYGSVGFDGGWWFGLGNFKEEGQWPVTTKFGNPSGPRGIERYSVTSFYIKKMSNFESAYNKTEFIHKRWDYPILRLADLYLLYAEALNELLDEPNDEVYEYVDIVRLRAGLKEGVKEAWAHHSMYPDKPSTKDGMREIIRRERSIELAFEDQRFFDLRRWKLAPKELSGPVQGWNYSGEKQDEFYQVTTIDNVVFTQRDVLWPIRQYELSVNTNLIQNPGW